MSDDWIKDLEDEDGNLDPVKCYDYGVQSTKEPWRKIGWHEGFSCGMAVLAVISVLVCIASFFLGGES